MIHRAVVIAVVTGLLGGLGPAAALPQELPLPAQGEVVPLRPEPVSEATALEDDLVGRFLLGTGYTSWRIEIRPDGRFECLESGCVATHRYVGRVERDGEDLVLRSEASTDLRHDGGTVASSKTFGPYVPVRWGERLYLVGRDQGDEFCQAVNVGSEPRSRSWGRGVEFILRDSDWDRAAEGRPQVPAEWQGFLLPGPVIGRVTAVDPAGTATIDLGAADGLAAAMQLTLHFQRASDEGVADGQAWFTRTAVPVLDVEPGCARIVTRQSNPPPRVGDLVTGHIPVERPLPFEVWRAAGSTSRLTFDPLPPLPGTSADELERWTQQIKLTFSPGVPMERVLSARAVDELTPAFFNALRGLDMKSDSDVQRATAILEVWKAYRLRCPGQHGIRIDFTERSPTGWQADLASRIWQVETFVMWWREMSADPNRLADFQRGEAP